MIRFAPSLLDACRERGGFVNLIQVERTGLFDKDDKPIWEQSRPLFYFSKSMGCWLMVPEKFRHNFASVPRLPFVYWWYGDRCWEEPALHDQLYTDHFAYVVTFDADGGLASIVKVPISRKDADALFLEALLLNPKTADGMDHTMHKAVRLGGSSSWDQPTADWQNDYAPALA